MGLSNQLLLLVMMTFISNGTNDDSEIVKSALPAFTWIDQARIEVKFPDGSQDRIILWTPKNIAQMYVKCLFEGSMVGEATSDVVVSGCKDDPLVFITIHSNRLMGRAMFNVRDNVTEEVHNPYAKGNLLAEVYDYDDKDSQRSKRSVFEDYILEDYDEDYSFDGIVPPRLKMNIKLGFEESLKKHLGSETAARDYVVTVFTHSRSYMKHNSLGTSLDLILVEPPVFVPNKHWKARRSSLVEAKTVKANENVPIIFFCFDGDDDNFMGVSRIRRGCDPLEGVGIVKYRQNVQVAANTLNHEQGHLLGLKHDAEEDRKDGGNKNNPCHGKGFMSEIAPAERPTQFTVCNAKRFKLWYHNFGTCLTEVKIPENLKICPFLPSSWIYPCECKVDKALNVYIFCNSINKLSLEAKFNCRKQVHKLEINMLGDELEFGLESMASLQINSLLLYNVSKITVDFEPNVFKGSAKTLKEIKIQRFPGMERGARTIKTGAFSNLDVLESVQLGEDFQILQSKAFSGLPSIVNLKMEGVKTIGSQAFYDMASLMKLDLANNEIEDLGINFVDKVPKLSIIDLSNNSISALQSKSFENLPSLTSLFLNNNKIASIHDTAMTNLPKLNFLDIGNNDFQEMGQLLNSIKNRDLIINLKETKIQFLHEESFKPFLDNIVIQGGNGYINIGSLSLHCGCDVKWLFNQRANLGLAKFHNGICQDGNTLEEVDASMLEGLCSLECLAIFYKIKPGMTIYGGPSQNEGNVFYNGSPICDDFWTNKDATVFCKMLGYHTGKATKKSRYGRVSPPFSMYDVKCNGNEKSLLDCPYITNGVCSAGEGSGVICT